MAYANAREIRVTNTVTGKVNTYPTMTLAAEELDIYPTQLSRYLSRENKTLRSLDNNHLKIEYVVPYQLTEKEETTREQRKIRKKVQQHLKTKKYKKALLASLVTALATQPTLEA